MRNSRPKSNRGCFSAQYAWLKLKPLFSLPSGFENREAKRSPALPAWDFLTVAGVVQEEDTRRLCSEACSQTTGTFCPIASSTICVVPPLPAAASPSQMAMRKSDCSRPSARLVHKTRASWHAHLRSEKRQRLLTGADGIHRARHRLGNRGNTHQCGMGWGTADPHPGQGRRMATMRSAPSARGESMRRSGGCGEWSKDRGR